MNTPSAWQDAQHDLRSIDALRSIYPEPQRPAAAATLDKECDHVHPLYREFIERAPFCLLATRQGDSGRLDISPRGDPAAELVRVVDEGRSLLLPDRRGNNRIDSLRNLVADPELALIFLIPGIGETIRVQGRARISVHPQLLADFPLGGSLPRSVLVIAVHKVFFQCARALTRAGLWDPAARQARNSLPSTGSLIAALSTGFDGQSYDEALPTRQQATLY
jgi:PPOX class probable FMN-dependent enzyme